MSDIGSFGARRGGTTPPLRRHHHSRQRRWRPPESGREPPVISPRTPPGSSSRPWPTTFCRAAGTSPRAATRRPAPPHPPRPDHPRPHGPPGTAAAASSSTCPRAAAANRPGRTSGRNLRAARPRGLTSPDPVRTPHAARHTPPDPGPGTSGHAAEPSAAGQTRPKTPRGGESRYRRTRHLIGRSRLSRTSAG